MDNGANFSFVIRQQIARGLILSDINKKEPAKADSSKSRHEDSLA